MKLFVIFWGFLAVFLTCGQARAEFFDKPQIAVSESQFCLLDKGGTIHEDDIGCWDFAGNPVPNARYALRVPRQITAGRDYFCAIDLEGIKCWGREGDERTRFFQNLKQPKEIAAGMTDTCAIDGEQGVVCYSKNDRINSAIPREKNLWGLSVGRQHACAISQKGALCWGGTPSASSKTFEERMDIYDQDQAGVEPRRDLAGIVPQQIAVGQGKFTCDIDRNQVACWPEQGGGSMRWSSGFAKPPALSSLTVGRDFLCFLDKFHPRCWKLDPLNEAMKIPFDLGRRQSLSAYDLTVCGVGRDNVRCWGGAETKIDYSSFLFRLGKLEYGLDRLAEELYPAKAKFMTGAAQILREMAPVSPSTPKQVVQITRLFVFTAIQPLLEDINTAAFEARILPRYQAAKRFYDEKYQRLKIEEFERTPILTRLALQLFRSLLESCEGVLTTADQAELQTLKLAIAKGLSATTDAEVKGAVGILKASNLPEKFVSIHRLKGLGEVMAHLTGFLNN